jgi:hypothetical protein
MVEQVLLAADWFGRASGVSTWDFSFYIACCMARKTWVPVTLPRAIVALWFCHVRQQYRKQKSSCHHVYFSRGAHHFCSEFGLDVCVSLIN